jgi:hypothetical protein
MALKSPRTAMIVTIVIIAATFLVAVGVFTIHIVGINVAS